jgi:hypothetical protein
LKQHIEKLGRWAEDRVTGVSGTITSVCFDLYGCIQVILTPLTPKDGKTPESHWLDIKRLKISARLAASELI